MVVPISGTKDDDLGSDSDIGDEPSKNRVPFIDEYGDHN